MHLPDIEIYRSLWESYGVTWIEPAFNNRFLANAMLPKGWELRCLSYNSILRSFTLFDDKNLPRVTIRLFISSNESPTTVVFFLNEQEIRHLFHREQPRELTKKYIDDNRSDTWSENHPFSLSRSLPKRIADDQSGLHRVDLHTNFADDLRCFGFFATEELAGLAKKFIETHVESPVRALKMEKQEFEDLTRSGYTLINPFI